MARLILASEWDFAARHLVEQWSAMTLGDSRRPICRSQAGATVSARSAKAAPVAQALPLPVENVKGVLARLVYAPELAAHLRIEERELEAGGVN